MEECFIFTSLLPPSPYPPSLSPELEEKLSVLSSEVNAWETKATVANQEGGSCSFLDNE